MGSRCLLVMGDRCLERLSARCLERLAVRCLERLAVRCLRRLAHSRYSPRSIVRSQGISEVLVYGFNPTQAYRRGK